MAGTEITPSQAGAMVRQDLGGNTEMQLSGEQQVQVMAAREIAEIKGLFGMARQFPRDMLQVRGELLASCRRPGFAEKAMYKLPRGKTTVKGLSIRFAEDVLRTMGNMMCTATITEDSIISRTYRVRVLDLERLAVDSQDVMVAKTIERKADFSGNPPAGYEVVSQRLNKQGEKLFIVKATEDDLLISMNRNVSKMRRNKILELLPFDIRSECIDQIESTIALEGQKADAEKGKNPDAYWKKLADTFMARGIQPKEIVAYLGHPLEQSTDAEVNALRDILRAIGAGETTWRDEMAEKESGKEKGEKPAAPSSTPPAADTVDAGTGEVIPAEGTLGYVGYVLNGMKGAKDEAELKLWAARGSKGAPKSQAEEVSKAYVENKKRLGLK